jgi:hypothetical protein
MVGQVVFPECSQGQFCIPRIVLHYQDVNYFFVCHLSVYFIFVIILLFFFTWPGVLPVFVSGNLAFGFQSF